MFLRRPPACFARPFNHRPPCPSKILRVWKTMSTDAHHGVRGLEAEIIRAGCAVRVTDHKKIMQLRSADMERRRQKCCLPTWVCWQSKAHRNRNHHLINSSFNGDSQGHGGHALRRRLGFYKLSQEKRRDFKVMSINKLATL